MQPHPLRSRFPARRARTAWAAWLCVLALAALPALAGCQAGDEFTSEGSTSSPVQLTVPTTARDSTVGGNSSSYYSIGEIVGLGASTMYTATISNLLSDADLLLFTDKFTTSVPCANHNDTSGESCSYTTPSDGSITALYIQVKSFSDTGTDFQLTVQ